MSRVPTDFHLNLLLVVATFLRNVDLVPGLFTSPHGRAHCTALLVLSTFLYTGAKILMYWIFLHRLEHIFVKWPHEAWGALHTHERRGEARRHRPIRFRE